MTQSPSIKSPDKGRLPERGWINTAWVMRPRLPRMTALLYIMCCSVVLRWQLERGSGVGGALKPQCELSCSQQAFRHNGCVLQEKITWDIIETVTRNSIFSLLVLSARLSGALSIEKQLHQSPTYRLAGWILRVWFTTAPTHITIRTSAFMLISVYPTVAALIKTVLD